MKWRKSLILLACGMLSVVGAVHAQTSDTSTTPDRYYLDEEIEEASDRYGLGIGFGLVDLGDDLVVGNQLINDDDIEQYYAVNFRVGFGKRNTRAGSRSTGYRGYIEPEVGYWENNTRSDLLVGLNIIGATPVGSVEFFVGGGIGLHFIDTTIEEFDINDSEDAIGVNAQFGADVALGDHTSLFAMGRFDLVDADRGDTLETKAYVGLRFRFGGGD